MKYKVGDLVRVISQDPEEPFTDLEIGVEAKIIEIWEDENDDFPYELEGYYSCVGEKEIELVTNGD